MNWYTAQPHYMNLGFDTDSPATVLTSSCRCEKVLCDCPPDVLVRDDEGLAQRLGRVEPYPRVLLHGRRQLTSDRSGAGVQSARNRRQESLICAARTDTWEHNAQRNYEEEKQTVQTAHSIPIDYARQNSVKHPEGLWAAPSFSPAPRRCHRHSDRWASSPKIAAEKNIFSQLQELYPMCNYVLLVYKHKFQFAQLWICWKC